jgi:hypothetical protein
MLRSPVAAKVIREVCVVFNLAGGAAAYSVDDAFDAVREYAFATVPIAADARFPDAFEPHEVPKYAYRAYDCVPASPGRRFTDLDLLVGAGLNARIDMTVFVRLRSFADRAAGHLDVAHRRQPDFLQLTPDEVDDDPPEGSAGWHLNRAWQHGMATPELDVARVHKTLHHKRPWLVPLLDNRTAGPIAEAAEAGNGSRRRSLVVAEALRHPGLDGRDRRETLTYSTVRTRPSECVTEVGHAEMRRCACQRASHRRPGPDRQTAT